MARILALIFVILVASPLPVQAQRGPQGPTDVIVSPVELKAFSDRVEALGTTKANETVVITADTSEKVSAIHFEDGQEVKQGDLLITLDKDEEEAELSAAEARLVQAQSAYDRAKDLQTSSALSKATLQERLAALKEIEADIAAIKARIEKRDIAAPFDGVLGLREVSMGALVQPGDEITTIDDLSQIKVDFDVPAVYLSTLKSGLPIIGHVDAFGDKEFRGEVRTVNTQVDPVTRTVKVRAILPNEDKVLRPGLLMTITLLNNERKTLLIPEEALIKRSDKNLVYVVTQSDGKTIAKATEIKIGTRQPGVIEVLSGLSEGERIVSHGTVKISDGAEISIRATEANDETLDELLKQNAEETGKAK